MQTCNIQQQQQQQQNYSQVFTVAPPTPPSDASEVSSCSGAHYLSPQPIEQLATTRLQQPAAWMLQQPAGLDSQQQQQQQHETRQQQANHTSQGNCNHNNNNNNTYHHQQQAASHPNHHSQQQQQTPIANYYYDIDDGFSDIMSAPPTPEPHYSLAASAHLSEPQQQQQQQQQPQQQQPIKQEAYLMHNYLPYEAPPGGGQAFLNQQQPQCMYTPMGEPGCPQHYSSAMSPDSLSTTSSSPSDHSLYQLSPPMSCSVQPPAGLHSPSAGQFSQQQQPQVVSTKPIVLVAVDQQQQPQHQQQRQQQNKAPTLSNHQHHHQHRSSPIHLWEFLKELLQQVEAAGPTPAAATAAPAAGGPLAPDASVIRWLDRQKGVFKIEDSVKVAKLWGKRKNKPKMNYDKLSRSIRQYYKKGIMKKTDRSQRLVYQFCSAYCH